MRDDLDAAESAYRAVLDQRPSDVEASTGLARVSLLRRTRDADPAAARRLADQQPDDVDAQCLVADLDLLDGLVDEAIDRLVALVSRSAGDDRERARQSALALFDMLGNEDERVRRGRTALANALF